jgi:PfaD family protein
MLETLRERHQYSQRVAIGVAGGIGTPLAACAAFSLAADYIVTGSINQASVEAGTSTAVKRLLAASGITDCEMAPAADMFEMGVELQVLKRGLFFPMRAKKLYELYKDHESLEAIPSAERARLETQILRCSLDQVWQEVEGYFRARDPAQLERAKQSPKRKMALAFRWYLGMSSRWAKVGDPERTLDYQIWCGPAMGSFNDWVKGTELEPLEARHVAGMATHILRGAAFHSRVNQLRQQGAILPARASFYRPGDTAITGTEARAASAA